MGWCWSGDLGCRLPRWWLLALVLVVPTVQGGDEFRVKEVSTRLEDGTFLLNANLDFWFSPEALEALENGVPLTIQVLIQVREAGAWIWQGSLTELSLRYALRYKPLSERYEVYRLPGDHGRGFVSREAAIAALGELRDIFLVNQDRLDPKADYEVHLRADLDIEELPLPLRPMAYLRPAWKLGSPWTKWPLTP